MSQLSAPSGGQSEYLDRTVEVSVRIGVLALLATWCFYIVQPFITAVVWGIIISVAAYPGYLHLQKWFGGRRRLAATAFTVLALLALLIPTLLFSDTLVVGVQQVAAYLREGPVVIPPPPERVAGLPLIGKPLADFWTLASTNLAGALRQVRPQLQALSGWLLTMAAGTGFALLQFLFAIVIAGVLLARSEDGGRAVRAITNRLAGNRGKEIAHLAEATVRSVARGILGVAIIQSLLAVIGFAVVGLPGAGLWGFLCLLLAVVQIGPMLVLIPAVIYVFSTASTVSAVLFAVWCIFVGVIDNVLKPILLGRGVNVPMVVIFVGAIGGFLSMGIVGLFVGSIVLVLGYTLLVAWLHAEDTPTAENG